MNSRNPIKHPLRGSLIKEGYMAVSTENPQSYDSRYA